MIIDETRWYNEAHRWCHDYLTMILNSSCHCLPYSWNLCLVYSLHRIGAGYTICDRVLTGCLFTANISAFNWDVSQQGLFFIAIVIYSCRACSNSLFLNNFICSTIICFAYKVKHISLYFILSWCYLALSIQLLKVDKNSYINAHLNYVKLYLHSLRFVSDWIIILI